MFSVGGVVAAFSPDGRSVRLCEIRRAGEIWAVIYGDTDEEAQRRARLAARALNRERDLN